MNHFFPASLTERGLIEAIHRTRVETHAPLERLTRLLQSHLLLPSWQACRCGLPPTRMPWAPPASSQPQNWGQLAWLGPLLLLPQGKPRASNHLACLVKSRAAGGMALALLRPPNLAQHIDCWKLTMRTETPTRVHPSWAAMGGARDQATPQVWIVPSVYSHKVPGSSHSSICTVFSHS